MGVDEGDAIEIYPAINLQNNEIKCCSSEKDVDGVSGNPASTILAPSDKGPLFDSLVDCSET